VGALLVAVRVGGRFWNICCANCYIFGIAEVILVAGFLLVFKQRLLPAVCVIIYAFITLQLNIMYKFEPYYFSHHIFG